MSQIVNRAGRAEQPVFSGRVRPIKTHRTTVLLDKARVNIAGSVHVLRPHQRTLGLHAVAAFKGRLAPLYTKAYGAFRDFAFSPAAVPDPAMLLVAGKVSGVTANDGTDMRRVWMTVAPPQDYPVSGGGYAWRRAAFTSIGARFKDMASGGYEYIDGAQIEITPKAVTGPTPYAPARALRMVVHADEMNYVTNPQTPRAVASGATNSGTAITTVDGSYYAGSVAVSGSTGAQFEVYVQDGTATKIASSGVITLPSTGIPDRIAIEALLPVNGTAGTVVFKSLSGAATFTQPRVDRVSGPGRLANLRYLDGDMGTDYLWSTGGINASPSFYYRDRAARTYLLTRVLEENCPLGVIPAEPQFALLPTE